MKHLLLFIFISTTYSCFSQNKNDTIFNEFKKPKLVKLGDTFYGATVKKFEYDTLHNLVRTTGFDNTKKIKPYYHSIAIETFKYDIKGNLIEIRSFGQDEKLISTAFEDTPIIKRVYDSKNRITEEWYLNEKGNLRDEYAIAKYSYNNLGEKIFDGFYDINGIKENK